ASSTNAADCADNGPAGVAVRDETHHMATATIATIPTARLTHVDALTCRCAGSARTTSGGGGWEFALGRRVRFDMFAILPGKAASRSPSPVRSCKNGL